jgi:hypothetical protein
MEGAMRYIAVVPLFVAMFAATTAGAQRENESMVWRIQAGLNSSTLAGSDVGLGDLDRHRAAIIGVTNLAHVTRTIGVEFGAFYTRKGVELRVEESENLDIPFVNGPVEGTVYLHYIEFPLVLNVWLPASERVSLCVYAGPAGAIRTTAEIKGIKGDVYPWAGIGESADLSSYTTEFDFLGIVGGTAVVQTGPIDLLVGLRWARSLRSVDDSVLSLEVFNSTYSVLAGIGIPLRSEGGGGHGVFQ